MNSWILSIFIMTLTLTCEITAYRPCWRDCDGMYTQCGQAAPKTFEAVITCFVSLRECRVSCKREQMNDNVIDEQTDERADDNWLNTAGRRNAHRSF